MDTEDNPQTNPDQPNKVDDTNSPGFEGISQSGSTPAVSDTLTTNDSPPSDNHSDNHFSPPAPDSQPVSSSPPAPSPSFGDSKYGKSDAEPTPSSTPHTTTPPITPAKIKKPKPKLFGGAIVLACVVVVAALMTGSYILGKHHERVVIQAPTPQPINLPPQAVVLNACVPGRGKQYIVAKNIPTGPIYDVENSKVIAIEYNLSIDELFTDSDTFSNAILGVTKEYSVNHFSILPSSTSSATATPTAIHLIMFTVSKAVANSITCGVSSSTTSS